MKAYGGVQVQFRSFLISALDEDTKYLVNLRASRFIAYTEPVVTTGEEAGWAPEPVSPFPSAGLAPDVMHGNRC